MSQEISSEQKHYQDSLWQRFNDKSLHDTMRAMAIDDLAWDFLFFNPDSTIALAKMELVFAKKVKLLKWQARAYTNMGAASWQINKYDDAIKYYTNSKQINIQRKDNRALGTNESNISLVYFAKSDFLSAIDYVYKSLRLYESLDFDEGKIIAYNNLGMIFSSMGKPDKALEFYSKAINFDIENKITRGLSLFYNNGGIAYFQLGKYDKAKEYYQTALKLAIQCNEPQNEITALNELGGLYYQLNDLPQAETYLQKCLALCEKMNDKEIASQALNNLGKVYLKLSKNQLAIDACKKGLKFAEEIGLIEAARNHSDCLYKGYKALGDKGNALMFFEKCFALNDSMQNINNRKEIARKELQYDYEKRTQLNKIIHERDQSVREARIRIQNNALKRERALKYFLYAGLFIIIGILLILFRRYKISRQQKIVIEKQKHEVEEKNKDITDSINYAQRIQRSFLPKKDELDEMLGEYFVLFEPKDIVSGDFYWGASVLTTSKTEEANRVIVFATGDCTGHGVPGAMMTMIGNTLLNQTLKNPDINTPADALHFVNTELPKNLKKQKGETTIRDGMDLVMIAIDRRNKKLYMAGANNSLYLLRDKKLIEYKGDAQSVSATDDSIKVKFTDHRIDVLLGDIIYMTTDGYPDQFGGPKGKKFKYKQLEEILISVTDTSMTEQHRILKQRFEEWKGDLEQVDDVTIVGIKI